LQQSQLYTSSYNDATVWSMRAELEQYSGQFYVNGYELEPVLRRLKNTSPGCDGIPAWVYRKIVLMNWRML